MFSVRIKWFEYIRQRWFELDSADSEEWKMVKGIKELEKVLAIEVVVERVVGGQDLSALQLAILFNIFVIQIVNEFHLFHIF